MVKEPTSIQEEEEQEYQQYKTEMEYKEEEYLQNRPRDQYGRFISLRQAEKEGYI